jgi:protein import protein ZIM17
MIFCPLLFIRHLIADHIGWFKNGTEDGKYPTIEDLLKAKGERIMRGRIDEEKGILELSD